MIYLEMPQERRTKRRRIAVAISESGNWEKEEKLEKGDGLLPSLAIRGRGGETEGGRLNGVLGLSLNDRTIPFLAILLDKTVSVG